MLGIVELPDEALRWNERAMQLAEASTDPACKNWLGPLYNNIGWTYHDQKKDYEKALEIFKKALVVFEARKDPGPILIARYAVARALRSLNRIDEALAMQQAIHKEYEKTGSEDGYVLEELGECHLVLKHADEAQKYFALAYKTLVKDEWLVANEPDRLARLKKLGKVE
jgi:tetratricopeptide (TPR) repeat protein